MLEPGVDHHGDHDDLDPNAWPEAVEVGALGENPTGPVVKLLGPIGPIEMVFRVAAEVEAEED